MALTRNVKLRPKPSTHGLSPRPPVEFLRPWTPPKQPNMA
ncbi:10072_t:CDS:2 [Rhizophagus irregularis]|nr:10072_t:CDS:2 [Rhizophagus irregularis]